jgi:hypothetical protein
MQATAVKPENLTDDMPGVVYRTVCQNPGCAYTFDLRITPKNAGLLSGTLACPRCKRHGGMLKPSGKLRDKLFSAKLVFKAANISYAPHYEEDDLVSEMASSDY